MRSIPDRSADAEVGARVRRAAAEAGLTLRALSQKLGVSRPTIYAYASGTLRIPDHRLASVAEILGRPVTFFRPQSADDLDPTSEARRALALIDAFMSPPDPAKALEAALATIENSPDAGNAVIRAEFLRRAGNARATVGDHLGALRNLQDAMAAFEAAGRAEDAARCAQTLGLCFINLGRLENAETCFQRASQELPPAERWKGIASLASLAERRGDYADAHSKLQALVADDHLSETAQVYVRATYASMTCTQGFWRTGLALSEAALSSALEQAVPDQANELMIACGRALCGLGRYDEAWTMHVRAADVAISRSDAARRAYNAAARAQLANRLGDHATAREDALEALGAALEHQFVRAESLARLVLAETCVSLGQYDEALAHATQVRSHALRVSYPVALVYSSALLAVSSARLGRPEKGLATVQQAAQMAEGLGEPRAWLLVATAECKRTLGEEAEAQALLDEAQAVADEAGSVAVAPWPVDSVNPTRLV